MEKINWKDPETGKQRKEYSAWGAMKARCLQQATSWSERYSESRYNGMEIEGRWLDSEYGFTNFYNDVGPAPTKNHFLDRVDNEKGYILGNVKWSTVVESNQNKSNTRFITLGNETKTLQEWSDELGISSTAVRRRIDLLGWAPEDAVSKRPIGPRPSNDEYYLAIAGRVALRSTCARRAVGCVLTDQYNYVLSTGYNGVAAGLSHCTDVPCQGANELSGEGLHKCEARHAEDIAISKCKDIHAVYTAYCTTSPCIHCVRRLLDTSCERIVFVEEYPHSEAAELWRNAGLDWLRFDQL